GVLPKITRGINKQADVGVGTDAGMGATAAEAALDASAQAAAQLQFDFIELSNLLASMRRLGLTRIPNYNAYSANPGPVMANTELLALLTMQQRPMADTEEAKPIDIRQ